MPTRTAGGSWTICKGMTGERVNGSVVVVVVDVLFFLLVMLPNVGIGNLKNMKITDHKDDRRRPAEAKIMISVSGCFPFPQTFVST